MYVVNYCWCIQILIFYKQNVYKGQNIKILGNEAKNTHKNGTLNQQKKKKKRILMFT